MITGTAFVDLSAAYDTVNHIFLIQKLFNNIMQENTLCRVFQNLLSNRIFYVELTNERSRWRIQKKNGSKRHRLHAVELSHRSGKPCANCVDHSRPLEWGPDYCFLASRPCGPAGWLAMLLIKADDVETNPGPTLTCK